jgi:hypothetical protein
MHDIIPHRTIDMYQEITPDGYCIAMLFLFLLSKEIDGFRILHVHPASAAREPWELMTNLTRLFV